MVENALSTIAKKRVEITGSGRTDTGVHCEQQFFHADFDEEIDRESLLHKLNSFLSEDIAIKSIRAVVPEAHARFDAVKRSYEYRICMRKDPFLKAFSYYFFQPLDVEIMNEAAGLLLNYKDFQSFSKVKTNTYTFNCDVWRAEWIRENELLTFYVSANRFLRGMVRALTGTLLDVGLGRVSLQEFEGIILKKDRESAGRSAPAKGLFLTEVVYPPEIFLN